MSDSANPLVIPKLGCDKGVFEYPVIGKPGWWKVTDITGKPRKPLIRCNCGHITGIGLHHVHSDGCVTNSFYHKRGTVYPEDPEGCEWHEWLKLADWDMGDFPPDPK